MSGPRLLYHLEGLIVGVAAATAYFMMHESALWFFLLILAPDMGMLGYLVNAKVGSYSYNLFHTYIWPTALGCFGLTFGYQLFINIALIWAAHIGFDRALGFGLKYPTNFKDIDAKRL